MKTRGVPSVFCDMHLDPENPEEAKKIAEILKRSGYKCVGISRTVYTEVNNIFANKGFKVLKTVVIEASNEKEARAKIKLVEKNRHNLIVIGRTSDIATFRLFSRDTRVDIVEISRRTVNLVDRNEAAILKTSSSYIGMNLRYLLRNIRSISWLGSLARRVYRYDIPFVIYSSARQWNQLWHPRHVYALFQEWIEYGRYAYLGLASDVVKKHGEN